VYNWMALHMQVVPISGLINEVAR